MRDAENSNTSRLPELIALAREPSSERRRQLLRELTEQFFGSPMHCEAEAELYSDVFARLLFDMETAVRAELALRFSVRLNAPHSLIRRFASDEIEVAEPILRSSPVLTDEDLLAIVMSEGQEHLRAVSQRAVVSEAVADMIVERSDDETLQTLLGNDGATLSRRASEDAVERAKSNPALHSVAVDRKALPPDLLNELYFVVESELRRRIIARNASLNQDLLENALSAGLARLATEDGVWPKDYMQALAQVKAIKTGATLLPNEIVCILRTGNRTAFCIAMSELTGVDVYTVSRIVEHGEIDGMAVLCRAADLDDALFLTIALSVIGNNTQGIGKARSYSLHYAELTQVAALRTLRFWRMRRTERPDTG
ncbi:MAG: DUF2336 domain-containing protein [Brevundimonas sp.]